MEIGALLNSTSQVKKPRLRETHHLVKVTQAQTQAHIHTCIHLLVSMVTNVAMTTLPYAAMCLISFKSHHSPARKNLHHCHFADGESKSLRGGVMCPWSLRRSGVCIRSFPLPWETANDDRLPRPRPGGRDASHTSTAMPPGARSPRVESISTFPPCFMVTWLGTPKGLDLVDTALP